MLRRLFPGIDQGDILPLRLVGINPERIGNRRIRFIRQHIISSRNGPGRQIGSCSIGFKGQGNPIFGKGEAVLRLRPVLPHPVAADSLRPDLEKARVREQQYLHRGIRRSKLEGIILLRPEALFNRIRPGNQLQRPAGPEGQLRAAEGIGHQLSQGLIVQIGVKGPRGRFLPLGSVGPIDRTFQAHLQDKLLRPGPAGQPGQQQKEKDQNSFLETHGNTPLSMREIQISPIIASNPCPVNSFILRKTKAPRGRGFSIKQY